MSRWFDANDEEVACLGCPRNAIRRDTDENGLCYVCQAEQIATAWFANQPSLARDDAFDKLLDFQLELHPPQKAVATALVEWLYAPVSRVDDVGADIQECLR